ncbi:hypothetical protein B2J96_13045 [Mycobacterium shigaense]|nr:hypothetical protein B2J96_13045 [Mycobacterium shigaense]
MLAVAQRRDQPGEMIGGPTRRQQQGQQPGEQKPGGIETAALDPLVGRDDTLSRDRNLRRRHGPPH